MPWEYAFPEREEQSPAQAGDHHQQGVHPGLAGVVDKWRADRRQPGRPEAGRPVKDQEPDPVDQADGDDPANHAQRPARGFGRAEQPDPALQQERMQRRAGRVDLKQPIEERSERWSRGQPHGHDLVVPETELAQLPCAESRGHGQDDDKIIIAVMFRRKSSAAVVLRQSGGSRQIHDRVESNEEAEDRLPRAGPLPPGHTTSYTIHAADVDRSDPLIGLPFHHPSGGRMSSPCFPRLTRRKRCRPWLVRTAFDSTRATVRTGRHFGSSTKVTSSVFPSGSESFRLAVAKPSAETVTFTSRSGRSWDVR